MQEKEICLTHNYQFNKAENGSSIWICAECGDYKTEYEDCTP